MRYSETTLVKEVMADPEVLERLGKQMTNAREGCAVAAIYGINGNDTVAEAKDRLLEQHPYTSMIAVRQMGNHIPEFIVEELIKHIGSDKKIAKKALRRIPDLNDKQREFLNGCL